MYKYLLMGAAVVVIGVGGWIYVNHTPAAPAVPTASPTSSGTFIATPVSGSVPFSVDFSYSLEKYGRYATKLDYGDGTKEEGYVSADDGINGSPMRHVSHTYTAAGTYTATLMKAADGTVLATVTVNATTRAPLRSTSVIFNPKDIAVGDQLGAFKVTKAYYGAATPSYAHDQYLITFAGTLTFTGVYGKGPEMGCFIPLENVPASAMQQLPRVGTDQIPRTLNLDVADIPQADWPATGDVVEVTIDRFVAAYEAKECGTDYAHVESIKKIPAQ
jgi:hypothetical protein